MGFDGLTGQDSVKKRLLDIVSSGGGARSLLFEGPEGVGKHLFAKETAKAFLCMNPGPDGACGKCASCKYIEAGTHPDLIEVEPTEGRKNIRVADLRAVMQDAEIKPQISERKVLIINADRTENVCQNLMLKSLEEPSSHLIYILLCSDTSRIIPTVMSRVTEIPFREYEENEMIAILKENGGEDLDDGRLSFLSTFSSKIPGKAIKLMSDPDFMDEREHIFDLIMNMPRMGYTDILYDEFQYFDRNHDKTAELLLLLVWTLGDIASAIAVPDPGNIKNSDKKEQVMDFVSHNPSVTLVNICNAQEAVSDFADASHVNATFEVNCCNMLLRIYKELHHEKNS